MSHKKRLVLKSACLSTAALMFGSICCSSALAQKYAEQSGKKSSYSKSYANTQTQATSYAQRTHGNGSSYASSSGVPGGTSYAQSYQAQSPSYLSPGSSGSSYASSLGSGSSYARSSSYANSSKAVPYSQQIRLGKSTGGSILGIMRGAPVSRNTGYSSNVRPNNPAASYKSEPAVSSAKPAVGTAAPAVQQTSIFSKLRRKANNY